MAATPPPTPPAIPVGGPPAIFGQTPGALLNRPSEGKGAQSEALTRWQGLLNAMHDILNLKNLDMETQLEWENIEGEVMADVLRADVASATMGMQLRDEYFTFAKPQECIDKVFTDRYVEKLSESFRFPPLTVMKKSLNTLMVSYKRQGREDMIRMIQSLQVSMAEHEHNDTAMKRLSQRLP